MIKILVVPDMHLFDTEIDKVYTAGYAEQSLEILQNLRKILTENSFDIVVLGGDIQHGNLSKMKYISKFYKELNEISRLVTKNTNKPHILSRMSIKGKDTLIDYEDPNMTKLFTLKGQHDTAYAGEYNFYDMLIENNVICNPSNIRINDLQINLFNHRKDPLTLKSTREPGVRKLIGIYHNPIKFGGQFTEGDTDINKLEDLGKYKNNTGSDTFNNDKVQVYNPTEHMAFANIDYAIMNDVHLQMQDQVITTYNQSTTVLTPGSIGRTDRRSCHMRDTAQLVEISVDEITYEISHKYITMELMPHRDLFYDNTLDVLQEAHERDRQEKETEPVDKSDLKGIDGKYTVEGIRQYLQDETRFRNAVKYLYKLHNDKNHPVQIDSAHYGIIKSMSNVYTKDWEPSDKQDKYIKSVIFDNYLELLTKITNKEI